MKALSFVIDEVDDVDDIEPYETVPLDGATVHSFAYSNPLAARRRAKGLARLIAAWRHSAKLCFGSYFVIQNLSVKVQHGENGEEC